MNRRQFIASLGVIGSGGAAAIGTGAFSSTEAERNIDVTVASDSNALLGIQPTDGPNGNYVDTTSNDALAINLTGSNNNIGDGLHGGQGLNANAITSIANVFEIKNQQAQTVEVTVTPLAYGDIEGSVFPPGVDGALAVLLVPENPDDNVEVDIEWDYSGWFPVPEDISFIGIKNLDPGQKLTFNLIGLVVSAEAIGNASISDQVEIHAREM
ncbi:hypothetical protein [Halobacterium jilantaiense]|uniref:SipW-cognate class signal peptide n=1 Tax=Halobacterium jilantaiense TaxID=355548 RepID=A0A1I0PVJ1_9EURY|nr:hypothetical protein [Halobacterium jilantaiense]SEW18139.1 hypothetical protein SAMN04487945_1975 [Halobacterium jilantaiense]